jgi:hypothetical protein
MLSFMDILHNAQELLKKVEIEQTRPKPKPKPKAQPVP